MTTNPPSAHIDILRTRREFLANAGAGFGALALRFTCSRKKPSGDNVILAARPSPAHQPGTAKSVIFLFMEGGPSHIDLFDPKPMLNELAGQPLPASFGPVITPMGEVGVAAAGLATRKWKQHGQSGTVGLRLAAAHRRSASTTSPSSAPAGPTASTTRPASAR